MARTSLDKLIPTPNTSMQDPGAFADGESHDDILTCQATYCTVMLISTLTVKHEPCAGMSAKMPSHVAPRCAKPYESLAKGSSQVQ